MGQMTREDALKESRRRWGERAEAWKGSVTAALLNREFRVGVQFQDTLECRGDGASWEAAFEDATRRESGREKGERK